MTPAEFRYSLSRLRLTPARFAQLVDVHLRQVQRWASDRDPAPVPRPIALLVRAAEIHGLEVLS